MGDIRSEVERLADGLGGEVSVAVRNVRGAFDFALNENLRTGAASTIKVSILLEALRQARDGELSLEAEFVVSPGVCCGGSGVLRHMHDGLAVTLKDLLTLMIIVSDNTATNMLIDMVGLEKVNSTLRTFGYTGTALQRKMYDWERLAKGLDNFVVAREMADLLARVARREALGDKWDELMWSILRVQQFGDELGLLLPEGVLANKTGQVPGVVNDCGIVTTEGFCYSIAVFTKDAVAPGEAKIAIGRISRAIFDAAGAGKTC